MVRRFSTRYFLHVTHVIHTAVIMGVMPLIGLLCAALATVAYGATTTVTLGVGDTSILVEGKTSPNSLVTIVDGSNVVGTTTTTASGLFSKKITAVQPGVHRLQIYARDVQNRLTDSIQIEMSATEHFQTDVYAFLPPTIKADQTIINPGQSVTYRGSTYPGSTVSLFFNEDQQYDIEADTQGQWSQTVPTDDLPLGAYEAYAYVTDASTTEQSYSTRALTISIILPAPQPLPVGQQPKPQQPAPSPRPLRPTTIHQLPNDNIAESPFQIQGTAEPMAQVELFNGGRPIGSTFADKKGNWSLSLVLQDPEYTLRARACTPQACSSLSNTVRLFYRPANNAKQFWAWLRQYAYVAPEGSNITLRLYTGNGVAPYTITTTWGDGSQGRQQHEAGNLTLRHRYERPGQYKGTITVTDASNKTAASMFSVRITSQDHARPFVWPLLTLVLLLVALAVTSIYVYWRLRYHNARS